MKAGAQRAILAVDPGTGKCGVAVVSEGGEVLSRAVVEPSGLWRVLRELTEEHLPAAAAVGDRTGSEAVWREVHNACQARAIPVHKVEEHRSTQQGRLRYWRENPRRGWRRLLPAAWLTPPEAFDDWVAVVLAERWLAAPEEAEATGAGG